MDPPSRSDDLVDWVCARAAANHSLSQCRFCEWFPLRELAPPSSKRPQLLAAECSRVQPKLAWFMCLTPATDMKALQHLDYVKAAIVSARLNAPSLAPYVVMVRWCLTPHSQRPQPSQAATASAFPRRPLAPGNAHRRTELTRGRARDVVAQISHEDAGAMPSATAAKLDEASRRFVAWLRLAGVPMLPHRLSFYDQLPMKTRTKRTSLNPNLNVGAFGRLDMGIIVEAMRDELLSRGLDGERVLYTDTDVLFANDFDYASLAAIPLPTFAAGTEVFSPAMNSGVMLINATAWAAHYAAMVAYGQRKNFRFLSFDQTWVHGYFKHVASRTGQPQAWEPLSDAAYNARGFKHPVRPLSPHRAPLPPRLWHWHGFKPHDVECWHRAIGSGAWPLRAWRNTVPGCTGKTRPRCLFMPVHNSGCRYFGRLTAVLRMTPCYLRTYTYLLLQHRRMLDIAHEIDVAVGEVKRDAPRDPSGGAGLLRDCNERAAARAAAWDRASSSVAVRARAVASSARAAPTWRVWPTS